MTNETETVAVGPHAWGSGPHESKAFRRMAENLSERHVTGDTTTVVLYTVRGDWELSGLGNFRAEEIVRTEELEVDTDDMRDITETLGELELAIESAMVDAEEVEEGDVA